MWFFDTQGDDFFWLLHRLLIGFKDTCRLDLWLPDNDLPSSLPSLYQTPLHELRHLTLDVQELLISENSFTFRFEMLELLELWIPEALSFPFATNAVSMCG